MARRRWTISDLVTRLDATVWGQPDAKRALAAAVVLQAAELARTPTLLVGPTGSGKTLLARTLAQILDVPFAAVDASQLVPDGYKGSCLREQLRSLLQRARRSSRAVAGVVFVDEFDKLGQIGDARFRRHAATSLLTLLNGDPMDAAEWPWEGERVAPTVNLVVVCAGAFQSVRERVAADQGPRCGFAAGADTEDDECASITTRAITLADVREHAGLLPELLARFHSVATLSAPTPDDLAAAARRHPEMRALAVVLRRRYRIRLTFGASFFRRWAQLATRDPESGYRALATTVRPIQTNLVDALEATGRRRTAQQAALLLTAHELDELTQPRSAEWLRHRLRQVGGDAQGAAA